MAFTNFIPQERHLTNQILLNGSGVAAGDVDGDGWTDLYFCRLTGPNALYRSLGNWRFEESAETAGVADAGPLSTGCALLDLDGDGDLDLIVNSLGHGTHLFYNDGKGRFTRRKELLNAGHGGMSTAAGDLNGDGFLDLYIANYRTLGLMDIPNARATFKRVDGRAVVETLDGKPATHPDVTNRFTIGPKGSVDEHGQADLILLSNRGTNFTRLPFASGVFLDEDGQPLGEEPFDWGLSVMIRDANGDGLPDIYVCNDFQTPDRFWINQGAGKFRLASRLPLRKSSLFSMAVDFADVNRDGFDDLIVVDMLSRSQAQRMKDLPDSTPPLYTIGRFEDRPQYGLNTLFLNRGDQTYSEISQLAGVQASDWSWSCVFLDVDLDGWEDILISNGMERAARDLDVAEKLKQMRAARRMTDAQVFEARKMFPRLATANVAFRNRRDLTFEDASAKWNFNMSGVSHGIALADLDNDGDLDVVVNNLNAPAGIYRNESTAPRIGIRLKGKAPNTKGIGARILVSADGLPVQAQEMIAGGRYLSSDDSIRTFAVGKSATVNVEVRWRDGTRGVLNGLKPNHIYEFEQVASGPVPVAAKAKPTLFEDVSERLAYTHSEQAFDDYLRQPLLPRKLSQSGPPSLWADLNEDGWEDLILGGSRGGRMAVFVNQKNGSFQRSLTAPFDSVMKRDVTGLAVARWNGDKIEVIATLSNYEDGLSYGPALLAHAWDAAQPRALAEAWDSAAGAIAMADVDQDGDLDVFVGGSVISGRYPAAASSRLFLNNGGNIQVADNGAFAEAGLVNGAVIADFDGDSDADLLLACEWGSMRLFLNQKGNFAEVTERFGLHQYKGLWQAVALGDFDQDGKMDFVAGNWGRNSKYEAFRERPIRLYYGDFDDDGTFDLIESHYEPPLGKYVPDRQRTVLGERLLFVNQRFRSHAQYSTAGVEELLGGMITRAKIVEANWFETTVFLNRGDRFEPGTLPVEAQFSPAMGLCAGDFDGDGHEDIVLAQNYFAVQPETPRYDAGRALLLKGDGKGRFEAVPGQESGLMAYGEQRSVSAADFDRDGRLDLVLTQNGAEAKLYRNRGADLKSRHSID